MPQDSSHLAVPKPGPRVVTQTELRTVVVVDYQNIHLVGRNRFRGKDTPAHECLIHPLHFATRLVAERNSRQKDGHLPAKLSQVDVYRGQPDATHDPVAFGRNDSQAIEWRSSDPRVKVHLRTLRYEYQRDAQGRKIKNIHGKYEVDWTKKPEEKGVDVLCALRVYQAALDPAVDLVILASIDTDLIPALNLAHDTRKAKIETAFWGDRSFGGFGQLRLDKPRGSIWGTPLSRDDFEAAVDPKAY